MLPEGLLDRTEVDPVAVGRELDRVGEAAFQIGQEGQRIGVGAFADEPGRDQLDIRAERRPRPYVAVSEGALMLFGDVLLLGVAVGPDLVGLDRFAGKIAEVRSW